VPPVPDRGRPATVVLRDRAGLTIELLDSGAIFAIRHGDILINQVLGSPLDGGIGNVYLRRRRRRGISWTPLTGPAAPGGFRASAAGAIWEGTFDGIDYSCTLSLAPKRSMWFWTIRVVNTTSRRLSLDAVLAQDIGIADEAAVRSSERYTSQYLDHTILHEEALGFLVCSRQNLAQRGSFPWVMHGCLDGAVGYLTDGFQFYGLGYKATNTPAALGRPTLPNRNYQYEFALPTLQSRRRSLAPGETHEIRFFAVFEADHPTASGPADAAQAHAAEQAYRSLRRTAIPGRSRPRTSSHFDAAVLFESEDLSTVELERSFGSVWRHEERRDEKLLSFFHGYQQHVVLKAKELQMERPTGHIMRSGRELLPSDDSLAVTAWMAGVFSSQLTIGNTSFNKVLGVCRDPLNVLKASGQRIFIRTDHGYELLGVPSAFEMGPNSARWIYHDARRTVTVRVSTSLDAPVCRLTVHAERGGPLEFLVTHNVVLGTNEYDAAALVIVDAPAARVELRPASKTSMKLRYPEATFFIVSPDAGQIAAVGGDELLWADGADRGGQYVVVRTTPVSSFSLVLTGSILSARRARKLAATPGEVPDRSPPGRIDDSERAADVFWAGLAHGATLGGATGRTANDLVRLNDVLRWYLVDAVIHATSPHGLEQYSGAAWAVRDVCQGPVESLVATSNVDPLRDMIMVVYEHQDRGTGDWPQWFMFDRYRDVRAVDSHADIIHWPLKAVCDYVESTGDGSILDERVGYFDAGRKVVTAETEALSKHIERQIATIERDVVAGTALPVFAGGDWEDTLQPVDQTMAGRMVSTWTVELAYQTLSRYRAVCERTGNAALAERLAGLCARIRSDFNRYLVPDGVVAGLAHFGPTGTDYFLHPRDRTTGVSYRLLPMTRGVTSGMFDLEQAKRHVELIDRHLTFPDGVRLMDRPMEYRGGPSHVFRRAESAANFGREVGLQYVHAHIRYIEAMARMGRRDEAFAGLLAVCPIGLERDVPSALPRQSNAYFSSSDAAFADRRQASRRFARIKSGRVGVKGGWRIYSSGPGIYINQLVSNVLGLRRYFDDVLIDPVLPIHADGLTFDTEYEGRRVRYRYHVTGDGFSPREIRVNARRIPGDRYADNPYRSGGMLIAKRAFAEALDRDDNLVEIDI
jgi:cellobiose phosphorylase